MHTSRRDGAGTTEQPPHIQRRATKFAQLFRRASSDAVSLGLHNASHPASIDLDGLQLPSPPLARLAQRTTKNLRRWYLRHNALFASKRRTELDHLHELERSQMLFAQVFAVTPLVVVTASGLRPEDNDERKVPALLQQLSITVGSGHAQHYKNLLRVQLEYGGGPGLVKWEVLRGYRDLLVLRSKLRNNKLKRGPKLPKLPHPKAYGLASEKRLKWKNGVHAMYGMNSSNQTYTGNYPQEGADADSEGSDDGDEESDIDEDESDAESEQDQDETLTLQQQQSGATSVPMSDRMRYAQAVEQWLNRVKRIYMLRNDSNELMQFFELSHLSLKLAPEYQLHGKEGHMIVRSRASDMGWRVNHLHVTDLQDMVHRHTRKWVLVRDSFLVFVDNIYSTLIREVFLVDSYFDVKHITVAKSEHPNSAGTEHNEGGVGGVKGYEIDSDPEGEFEGTRAMPDVPVVLHKKKAAKSVFLHLVNNEREMRFATRTERDLRRWQASILQMQLQTPWSKKHRFDSFAPVRRNVFGQWFVDARDYMWVLSDALENARDTIYILDWWLSPELYLRRPPEGNQKWRLDRVLKRKAEQGVKIFVIVYRNVNAAIPIDSLWTKHSLLALHENVHVMRSPNQLKKKGALFWAHHEKLCIIDSTIAFNGGIDLCFGRWDTWEHTLIDDAPRPFLPLNPTEEEWEHSRTQLFPGKDYNNARVKDFYDLNRPYEETHDRNNVPRMPWHDVHQMVLGQPARDFCRHFVQRWNYVIRQKLPSRSTPFLLPPPDFTTEELERLQLTGTCEYQVLRSSGQWSLGLKQHEQSIQNAYLQLIEESEHFVYMENQFFITSTEVDGVKIENQIGDALVQRIVRAHERKEQWKAFILIPLMPGFEADIDSDRASSVRLICQCQFNSISRGPRSIFYRLEQMGIRPDQYINFLSLRKWGKFSDDKESPNGGRLTTELLYIHGKVLIVDDRIAIVGSANINERSMRGVRDSEVAVCVRDTKVMESTMAGKPYKVGKFAHTLRMRLMREHLGVDIDKLEIVERFMSALEKVARTTYVHRKPHHRHHSGDRTTLLPEPDPATISAMRDVTNPNYLTDDDFPEWLYPDLHSFNWYAGTSVNKGVRDHKKLSRDNRLYDNEEHKADVDGRGYDHWKARLDQESKVQLRRMQAAQPDIDMENEARKIMHDLLQDRTIKSKEQFRRTFYARFAKQDILRPLRKAAEIPRPYVDEEGMRAMNCENIPIDPWAFDDPVSDRFVQDMFLAVAERNTLIFRMVFRCQPDDEVETWKDYKTYMAHQERFYSKQKEDGGPNQLRRLGVHKPERVNKLVLSGDITQADPQLINMQIKNATNHTKSTTSTTAASLMSDHRPSGSNLPTRPATPATPATPGMTPGTAGTGTTASGTATTTGTHTPLEVINPIKRTVEEEEAALNRALNEAVDSMGFKPARKWGHFDHVLDAQVAEDILQGVTGHLVVFPTEWLNRELDSGNWNFQLDRMAPLEIYD